MGLIGALLYPLFAIIFNIINLLQAVFRGLAGVGGSITISTGDIFGSNSSTVITSPNGGNGGETTTGIIYYFLTSNLIKNLFMSILLLALFLIIIFTAMAFIKNAYASKQKTWQEIVGNAFKGLANFIFIPVCCLLGVWLSNILLVAIDGATSTGGATAMERKLFICCAYDANKYRSGDLKVEDDTASTLQTFATNNGLNIEVETGQSAEYYANIVDSIYAQGTVSIYKHGPVSDYYELFSINYLTLIVGGVFMLYVLVSLAYAMVKRMFILLMLFVISPAICAMYPLDEGSAVGNWKKEFIKYTIAAYGAVAGLNLFFSILPIVQNINIVPGGGGFTNEIFQLLIMVSGLFVVKEFMGTLSGWIGGDNALATGESLKKSATGAVKKYKDATIKKTQGAFKLAGQTRQAYTKAKGDSTGFKGFMKGFVGANLNLGKTALGATDKAGLNLAETFGWGYDAEGKKRKSMWAQGKKSATDRDKAIQSDKDLKASKAAFDGGVDKMGWSSMYGAQNDDAEKAFMIANFLNQGQDAGYSRDDLLEKLVKLTGEDTASLKGRERVGNKFYATATAEAIADKEEKLDVASVGGRTHVEDTMMERMENAKLDKIFHAVDAIATKGVKFSDDNVKKHEINVKNLGDATAEFDEKKSGLDLSGKDLRVSIEGLIGSGKEITFDSLKASSGADDDRVKKVIDSFGESLALYNAAAKSKQEAEQAAAASAKVFVEEMKKAAEGNAAAEKVLKKFEKAADYTAEALEKLAKELEKLKK